MKLSKQSEIFLDIAVVGLVVAVLAGLIATAIDSDFKHVVEGWFPHYHYAYLTALLVTALGIITFYFFIKKTALKGEIKTADQSPEDRKILINSLGKRYEERLRKKMDNDLKLTLELELKYTKEGTEDAFITQYYIENYKEETIDSLDTLFTSYEKHIDRLLIIGDPGSGKTTLLLRFAQKLISSASANPLQPIPVILNLSSWRKEYENFRNWLEENLVYYGGEFGTSKENAKILAQNSNLILLLDGLDEIPEDHRASCLQKLAKYLDEINARRDTPAPEVIICCRREEYKQIQAEAPVQAAVSIEPIRPAEIDKELEGIIKFNPIRANPANELTRVLLAYPSVKDLLTTAFHLHIALSLAGNKNDFAKIKRQDDLVKLYIQKEIQIVNKDYSETLTNKTLTWLAKKMTVSRKGITFELTDVQPTWLKNKWVYLIIMAAITGCAFGFMIPVFGSFFHVKTISFRGGFTLGFVVGLVTRYSFSLSYDEIRRINLSKIKFLNSIALLFVGVIVIIFIIVLMSIVYKIFASKPLSITTLLPFLICYCFIVLLIEFIFSETKRYPIIINPYKRLVSSFIFTFAVHAFSYCVANFFFNNNSNLGIFTITMVSILFGIVVGILLNPLLDYFIIQIILAMEKSTPLNLVKFLDTVSLKTGLMEKDGGQWRFRHKLIQEVFNRQFLK